MGNEKITLHRPWRVASNYRFGYMRDLFPKIPARCCSYRLFVAALSCLPLVGRAGTLPGSRVSDTAFEVRGDPLLFVVARTALPSIHRREGKNFKRRIRAKPVPASHG